MSAGKDLVRTLADDVRAAVRKASPASIDAAPGGARSALSDARDSLSRAAERLTPGVPEGARFEGLKRALLRSFRFLWRDQSSYNALALDAARSLADEVERSRDGLAETLAEFERTLVSFEERAAIQQTRLTLLESARPREAPAGSPPSADAPKPELPAGVYSLFEERFRGSAAAITEKQRSYLDHLRALPGPVLDVGCGSGEFLRLLLESGIAGSGVEINPVAAAACRGAGLKVEEKSAREALSAAAPASLGAIVAFQVVEHWSAAELFAFLLAARHAVAPGGKLILETINTDSLSALRAFFLDPTHVRPVPPDALRFLVEAAGFAAIRIEYRSPLPAADRLTEATPNDAKLNRLLYAPQDYALFAAVPSADALFAAVPAPDRR